MAYELKEGRGSLFKNEDKVSEKQPAMRGDFLLNGVRYRISAWTKESKDGTKKYLSLAVEEARDQPKTAPRERDPWD